MKQNPRHKNMCKIDENIRFHVQGMHEDKTDDDDVNSALATREALIGETGIGLKVTQAGNLLFKGHNRVGHDIF